MTGVLENSLDVATLQLLKCGPIAMDGRRVARCNVPGECGQVTGQDHPALGHGHRARKRVFQFPDVARPRVVANPVHGLVTDVRLRATEDGGVPSGKVIRGPGVLFWGTPARPIKQYLKELAILARMAKK